MEASGYGIDRNAAQTGGSASYDIDPNLRVSQLVLAEPSAGRTADMITHDEKYKLFFMQHMKVSGVGEGRSRRRLDSGA